MSVDLIGAIKIKDGLFLGDELAAQDLEFVVANKVTHVVNCAGRQVPNHWESIGVLYRTYCWSDNDSQVLLDARDCVLNEVFLFIEEALEKGESALIHSHKGQSRSVTLLAAYIIRKYRWSLSKALQFLASRKPTVNVKQGFHRQLLSFEKRYEASLTFLDPRRWVGTSCGSHRPSQPLSLDWSIENFNSEDDILLRNTFLNGQVIKNKISSDFIPLPSSRGERVSRKLSWKDDGVDNKEMLEIPGNFSNFRSPTVRPSILKTIRRPPAPPSPSSLPPPPLIKKDLIECNSLISLMKRPGTPTISLPASPLTKGVSPRFTPPLPTSPAPPQALRHPSPSRNGIPSNFNRQFLSSIKGPIRPGRNFDFARPPSASLIPPRAASPAPSAVRPPFSSARPPTPPISRDHSNNYHMKIPPPSPQTRTSVGILRRAPSPTPSFNRMSVSVGGNAAFIKARWRT